MKKKILFTALFFLIAVLSACAPQSVAVEQDIEDQSVEAEQAQVDEPAQSETITYIVDGLGREVILPETVISIVSLAPSNTELLFAVGAGDKVVGRDSFSDYPAEALELPDIGGSFSEYNLEAIVALQPDLVLAAEINTPELVQSLEDLGLTVFYLNNPTNLEGMYEMLRTVAALSGHTAQAEELIASLQERVQAVTDKLAQATQTPSVFYELDASDPLKPFTPGPGTFYTTLISLAGGRNIGAELKSAWAQISLEELLVQDPDFILLGDAMWGITPESVAERTGWEQLTAVQEGRVLPFDDNLLSRPGPRQVEGLEALANLLHPDLFK